MAETDQVSYHKSQIKCLFDAGLAFKQEGKQIEALKKFDET
jgi:hypothetical protein